MLEFKNLFLWKRILQEWIAALKEYKGVYKQGTGELHGKGEGRKKDIFCCLGVLCDLAVKAKVVEVKYVPDNNNYEYDTDSGLLPFVVRKWAGLGTSDGTFSTKDGKEELANLNDSGTSFKKIAKIIESKPEGLFV